MRVPGRRTTAACAVGVALAATLAGVATAHTTAAVSGTGHTPLAGRAAPAVLGRLRAVAVRQARADGVTIDFAQAVRSYRHTALGATLQDVLPDSEPVWLLQVSVRGAFGCLLCASPNYAATAQGGYLVYVLHVPTLQVDDAEVASVQVDLTRYGPVVAVLP